jgi:hypothetical protein
MARKAYHSVIEEKEKGGGGEEVGDKEKDLLKRRLNRRITKVRQEERRSN